MSLPSMGLASVCNGWAFAKAPAAGLNDIPFPMSMKGDPRTNGYSFTQQFGFNGVDDVGYCGFRLRANKNGKRVVRVAFSTLPKGATTGHKNCHSGADGDPRVSYAIDIFGN
ncbi:DUF3472 domain-containing protein [Fusarium pseudoanthophilum]|uniref:DUF3472 domain-containing protein n=1 Tax=Fusarium pseudoanthophilum TaxID=48495 RepID=A0A8H5JXA1_9HYPO|nr:DUF3472 domain-containing protein [Fusarium pseudoanthophilum]